MIQLAKPTISRSAVTIFALLGALMCPSWAIASPCSQYQAKQQFILCVRAQTTALFDKGPAKTIEQLSGGQYALFLPPNSNSPKGRLNSGIFRVQSKGKNLLIKTMVPDFNLWISDDSFERNLFGVLLGSELGGPKVTRAGRFEGRFGSLGYYIEMEELFYDDKNSFTYKGLFTSKNQILAKLGWNRISNSHLEKVGQMLGQLLERNIYLGSDVDLIFSRKTGDVRWIDTTDWDAQHNRSTEEWFNSNEIDQLVDITELKGFEGRMSVHNYGYFITYLYRLKPRYGEVVLLALRRAVAQSKVWSDQQKINLWDNIRINLNNDWHWKGFDLNALNLSERDCELTLKSRAQ
jgi:hypothetical protein